MIQLPNNFVRKPTDNFVGINLGNYYLKGLIVENGKVLDYFIERNENLSATIKKLWSKKKISTKKVKLCIKNPTCLVRYFPFPKMERKKMTQVLFYELSKFIPFSPEDVYFDFFSLGDANPSESLLLLAVVKKLSVDCIVSDFDKAGLKVPEITLDSICLINLFLNNYKEGKDINSSLLDIGHDFSTMSIVAKERPFLTRDVKFSTKDIFEIISRIKSIPVAEIEKWLKSSENSEEFLTLIKDSISSLCNEMKSSFDYFEVNKGESINKLYISGGLAFVKNIANIFAEYLDIEVETLEVIPKAKELVEKKFTTDEFEIVKNNFPAVFGLIL